MIPELHKAKDTYHFPWNNHFRSLVPTSVRYGMVLSNQKVRRRYVRYCKYIQLLHIAGSVVLFALAFAIGWVCMAIF